MANYVDYEKRLEQLDQQKLNMINRMERANRKAYDDAAFYIGKRFLSCYNNNQENVNFDGLEKLCKELINQINNTKMRDTFWVEHDNKNPGYNLGQYREAIKKRNKASKRYEKIRHKVY